MPFESILHLERMFYKNTETFVYNQIKSIKKYNVDVACIESIKRLDDINKIISPPLQHLKLRTKILNNSDQQYLEKQIKQKKYSLIHTHFISDASYFNRLTNKIKIPKVVSAYGYDVSEFPKRYFGLGKRYLKSTFQEYDLVLAMSEDMKKDLLQIGCPENKIQIHYHGINTTLFNNKFRSYRDKEIYYLLSVGTLCEKKGQYLVIEALNILVNKFKITNIIYKIVGIGPHSNLIHKKIVEYNLVPFVIMHGHVSHDDGLIHHYIMADIFVHACKTDSNNAKEGIPGVVVEAMANGLPVVTTYHAGIPSIITNNISGILINENNVLQIVDSILHLIESDSLRRNLGSAAQKYALNNLDLNVKTKYLENNIYANLISNHNK
jgi:colanic acid/amylovoran biosynthesis glycosyltransferase